MKENKKVILIIVIILIFLVILCLVLNMVKSNNQNINTNNNVLEDNINYEKATYHIDISKDTLFVNYFEEKYVNYSKKTSVNIYDDTDIYIDYNKLFSKKNDEIIEIDINDETPKYLEIGADCGGTYVIVLTNEGNIYSINNPGTSIIMPKIIYGLKNAEEIVRVTESSIFTTCGEVTFYALVNKKLFAIPIFSSENDVDNYDYKSREEHHPFSVAYPIKGKNSSTSKILLYPDGTLNKYIYNPSNDTDILNHFIETENGEKLLVSFIYYLDDIMYIITSDGETYKITLPNDYTESDIEGTEKHEDFIMHKVFDDRKIDFIDLQIQYSIKERRYDINKFYQNPELILHFTNGSNQKFSTANDDKIEVYLTDGFILP